MVKKTKSVESWHGRVVAVNDDAPKPEVAIYDTIAEEVRWFRFRAGSDLARVFRSMSALEQPLFVFERTGRPGFAFLSTNEYFIESIIRSPDGWIVRTSDANATVFYVKDSHNSRKTEKLVGKLEESRKLGKAVWIVIDEDAKRQLDLRGEFGRVPKTPVIDVLESSREDDTCDTSIPLPFEFNEEQHKPIDVRYAKQLFRELKAQSTDPESGELTGIPFLFPYNGCSQRCHAMARYLLEQGVFPLKIIVRGELKLRTPNHPTCEVAWDFHVAPAVQTNCGLYVIDPAVNKKAVPVQKWYRKFCRSGPKKIYSISHHIYAISPCGCNIESDPAYQTTNRGLAFYRNALRLQSEEYGFPPCKRA